MQIDDGIGLMCNVAAAAVTAAVVAAAAADDSSCSSRSNFNISATAAILFCDFIYVRKNVTNRFSEKPHHLIINQNGCRFQFKPNKGRPGWIDSINID